MQIDAKDRVFGGRLQEARRTGHIYGAPIYSVADGTVVNVYDEADEQVPGPKPTGITMANIGGNMMVVDIGDGAFAFYAHLQRGSLKAKLGDKVKAGQVLGLLGNTGNSTAPHLHFHLMDGTSPLNANGLPYVFRQLHQPRRASGWATRMLEDGGDRAGRKQADGQPCQPAAARQSGGRFRIRVATRASCDPLYQRRSRPGPDAVGICGAHKSAAGALAGSATQSRWEK